MSITTSLFEQAQLAEAAYADFADPNKTRLQALKDQGFSDAQAAEFVLHWKVVSQYNNSQYLGLVGTGFSATVFEKLDNNGAGTGEYSLAIRGSLVADAKLIATEFESVAG
ncbi:MAG: hypothetical protein Q8M99_10035 [Methylotenera sp.]|nr:hypothetical protein [Methylotenera sp.]